MKLNVDPLIHFAVDPNFAAHRPNQMLDDGQTQSGSAQRTGARFIDSIEAFEQTGQIVGRNTQPAVAHAYQHHLAIGPFGDELGGDGDEAVLRSVFNGIVIGDFNKDRLAHAKKVGFEPIDLSASDRLGDMIAEVTGSNEVDSAIDAVGFEARGHTGGEQPAIVLNQMMEITRAAGSIGIPGLYVTADPGAVDNAAKQGNLSLRFGLGWAKAQSFHTGQTPVLKYNRQLMQAILHDRLPIADIVNAKVISLEDAAQGYESFDHGAAQKFVLDPHGDLASVA